MPRVAIPDLALNASFVVDVAGQSILLCRTAAGVAAIRNRCPHRGLAMNGARVRGETVICPHHGARFRLDDGTSLAPDLVHKPVVVLPCRVEGAVLIVDTD